MDSPDNQHTSEIIEKGRNVLVLRNKGEASNNITIEMSGVSQSYFETNTSSPIGSDSNLLLTTKTIQACLKDFYISCDGSTPETSFDIPLNTAFKIIIGTTEYYFTNVQDYLDRAKEVLPLYTEVMLVKAPCENATEATGYIDIEGRWDLVLDNIVHLQNATALEISNYLNNTEDFIVTFDTDVEVRSEFDHLVLNYTWDEFNGVDLDTRSSISIPPRNVEVGWGRASNDLEYLTWAGDNTPSGGSESLLINLKEIIKDYPSLDKIKIQLKAFWYNRVLDGKFKLSFISYKDGIMTPNNYTFTNEGGTLVDYFSIDCYTKSQDRNGETIGFLDFDLINNKGTLSLGSGPINTITAPTQLRADFTV